MNSQPIFHSTVIRLCAMLRKGWRIAPGGREDV